MALLPETNMCKNVKMLILSHTSAHISDSSLQSSNKFVLAPEKTNFLINYNLSHGFCKCHALCIRTCLVFRRVFERSRLPVALATSKMQQENKFETIKRRKIAILFSFLYSKIRPLSGSNHCCLRRSWNSKLVTKLINIASSYPRRSSQGNPSSADK